MGILRNGILGSVSGKVSGVVGSTWKGRNTLRGYAKPSNPKTTAQVTQRGLFSFVQTIASLVLGSIIQKYWNPFASTISGFNSFMRSSLLSVTSNTDYANILMAKGSLENVPISDALYAGSAVTIGWSDNVAGNGQASDKVVGVVIDSVNNVAFVTDVGDTRDTTELTVTVGTGRTAGDLKAYLFFYRGTGASLIVSNSSYIQVTT